MEDKQPRSKQAPRRAPTRRVATRSARPIPAKRDLTLPIVGGCSLVYVSQVLVPTLKPGDIVIMDNLGSHKGQAVARAIRAARAHCLFLPPFSPDLHPIEQVFAKLKASLRRAAARTFDAISNTIATALDRFSPQECANYIRNAGYASN